MYIIHFAKQLIRPKNIPVIIYMVLNIALVTWFLSGFASENFFRALPYSLLIYLVGLLIALSPLGEWILRLQNGCKRIARVEDRRRLERLFQNVYARAAHNSNTGLSDCVNFYIKEDDVPNAFATGRRTVCVTRGLLALPDDMIEGVLAHEFGHLVNKDTDFLLLVTVGNMVVNAIVLFLRAIVFIFYLFSLLFSLIFDAISSESHGCLTATNMLIYRLVRLILFDVIYRLWTGFGTLLIMASQRSNEYAADAFAADLGFGTQLCAALDALSAGGSGSMSFFDMLRSSHPHTNDRIGRLQARGVRYIRSTV